MNNCHLPPEELSQGFKKARVIIYILGPIPVQQLRTFSLKCRLYALDKKSKLRALDMKAEPTDILFI
jgi:hypothetical protein